MSQKFKSQFEIDLSAIPAVAALIARNAELEGFRGKVATMMTAQDCLVQENEEDDDYSPSDDAVDEYTNNMDFERLVEEFHALESLIGDARALAAPSSGGAIDV